MIDITVKTDPERSYIQGRNGHFKLHAMRVHALHHETHGKIWLDGLRQNGAAINGGFEINTRAFARLCHKFLAAYVAGGGTFDDLIETKEEP